MRVRGEGARRRWGGTLVEGAVVGSLALMLLLGMVVVGNGVIRYQQVASLAREGSRYAAVNSASPPSASSLKTYLETYAAGMDPTNLSCTVSYGSGTVTVGVTYSWTPEAFLASTPMSLTSTSSVLVTN
jgi:Flp pilus assembly protein TadG